MKNPVDVCLSKKQYRTQKEALRGAKYRTKNTGVNHHPYRCKVCFGWHLFSGGFVGQPSIKRALR